jgi:S1-C subfamily serine protease
LSAVVALIALCGGAGAAFGWSPADARRIVQAHENAVITVQLVLETTSSYEGASEKHQRKISATGTVIDPSGLLVTSLSEVNPTESFNRFFSSGAEFDMSSRAVDAKFKMPDGSEIPADFVLRDPDLDLAFLRPKKTPQKAMDYVDLARCANPQALDEVLVLSRLGTAASRSLAATPDRIRAVATKPRTFYLLNSSLHTSLGGPVFTLDGRAAGISVLRFAPAGQSERRSRGGMDDVMAVVALPSASVAKIAEQAKKSAPIKDQGGR